MKILATIVAIAACACCAASLWLYAKTLHLYSSSDYGPNSAAMPSYSVGTTEADGNGIFLPSGLLMILGLFLAKFAWNLWNERR